MVSASSDTSTAAGLPYVPKDPVRVNTPDAVVTVTASPLPICTLRVCDSRSVGEITGSTHNGSGVVCGQNVLVGVTDGVTDGVAVAVEIGAGVAVAVPVGVGAAEAVTVGVGVSVGVEAGISAKRIPVTR